MATCEATDVLRQGSSRAGHIVVGTPDGQTGCYHIECFGWIDRLSCCSPAVGAHVDELNAIRPAATSTCASWLFFQEAPHSGADCTGLLRSTRATYLVAGLVMATVLMQMMVRGTNGQ